MNEDLRREFRAIQSAHQVLAGAYGRLADLFPVDAPGPGPPEPQPGKVWTHSFTPSEGHPASRIITEQITVRAIRAVLTVHRDEPFPEKGSELLWIAPVWGGRMRAKNGLMLLKSTLPGISIVTGPGLSHEHKIRPDIPGRLRLGENEKIVAMVDLAAGRARVTYRGNEHVYALPEGHLDEVKGVFGIQLGGDNALGSPHHVKVELL